MKEEVKRTQEKVLDIDDRQRRSNICIIRVPKEENAKQYNRINN